MQTGVGLLCLLRVTWVGGPFTMQEPTTPDLSAGGQDRGQWHTWDQAPPAGTMVPSTAS